MAALRASRLAMIVATGFVGGCNLIYPVDGYQARPPVGVLQQATATGSMTRSIELMLPPARGDALILIAASVNATPAAITGGGVTWTQQSRSSAHVALAVWVGFAPATQEVTPVTVSWIGIQDAAVVHLSDWSGPAGLGTAMVSGGTGGPIETAELSVPEGTAIVLAAAGLHNAPTGAPTNGLVALEDADINDTRLITAYRPAPLDGTISTSWAHGASNSWDAVIVAFPE